MTKPLLIGVIAALSLGGCSNSKLRQTPSLAKSTPWFCELNETRDDWDCVQDEEQARHPMPSRLPGDPPEPPPAAETSSVEPAQPIDAESDAVETFIPDATDRVLALPGDSYAVQLIAFNDADDAQDFVTDRGLSDALQLRLARDEAIYHVVILGVYDTYADAMAAIDRQRDALAGIEPWIRNLASVQEGMRAARVRVAGGQ